MTSDGESRPEKGGFTRLVLGAAMVALGMMIGLLLATGFDWSSAGHAVDEAVTSTSQGESTVTPVSRPLPVSVPPGADDQVFVRVADAATPAVVNISTTRVIHRRPGEGQSPFFKDPFFERFFGDEFFRKFDMPPSRRERSLGSGVIVDPKGYLVTNNHVVAQADEIKVLLSDGREFTGRLVGTDPKTDLAVVKIEAVDLPAIPWGDSNDLHVGEYVLAIGNPFGLNSTVTMGIISAVGRANVGIADYEDFIQTDAAINPGNSGGALVNTRGELIGINTAIFSRSGGYMGIGFAVPSNMVRLVMTSLIREGKVVRGWLGVSIQEVNGGLAQQFGLTEARGALVSDVLKGTPAERAGVARGDVVIQYNGRDVRNAGHLRNLVAETPVGQEVNVVVVRDRRKKSLTVKITEQPSEISGIAPGEPPANEALAGLEVQDLTPELADRLNVGPGISGVVVTRVESGSAAEVAGLLSGDVIVEVNRQSIKNTGEFRRIVEKLESGESLLLLVRRNGQMLFLMVSA